MQRIILHLDMDAFFTSCEEKVNPSLKGKPVVVGADPKNGMGRGVVSTANYEARRYGIKSAMPISRAYRLNLDAIFLPVNFSLYNEFSATIMRILKEYSNKFQQISVDEAYLDITEKANDFEEAKKLALKIKYEIMDKTGLTCSIGVASNKLIAKIASDHNKPDGLTMVRQEDNRAFLENLNARKLYGVGPKTEFKLRALGIKTIGQLAAFSKEKLIDLFGVYGLYLHLSANGFGDDFVAEEYGRLSIGREITFEENSDDYRKLNDATEEIAGEIFDELQQEECLYRTISIKIRLYDFKTFTRARTLKHLCNDKDTIINSAKELCREFYGDKIRLIGIRVSNLEEFKGQKTIEEFCPTFS